MGITSALKAILLLTSTLLLAAGCSDSDNTVTGTTPTGGPANSTLRVFLTDKPAEEYLAVNVTISAIRIHQSSSTGEGEAGWQELPVTAAMPVDLLKLRNGVLYELGKIQLPAGHYQQIRLQLVPNTGAAPPFKQSVVTADGVEHALDAPSGSIKIVHGISLDPAKPVDVTLDFDAAQSVKKQGNGTYSLQPVIKAL